MSEENTKGTQQVTPEQAIEIIKAYNVLLSGTTRQKILGTRSIPAHVVDAIQEAIDNGLVPTNRPINTAEEQIAAIKDVFLAQHDTSIAAMARDLGYGPETARRYRDACAAGYLQAIAANYSSKMQADFALGYGKGFTNSELTNCAKLVKLFGVQRVAEAMDLSSEEIDEALKWCKAREIST